MKNCMKRWVQFLMSLVLTLGMVMPAGVHAADTNTSAWDSAYKKALGYYKSKSSLDYADEVIAAEALGLEAEDVWAGKLPDFTSDEGAGNLTSDSVDAGSLAKGIIALALTAQDPTAFEGVNLVTKLENMTSSTGTLKDSAVNEPNYLVWVVMALTVTDSNKATTVADYLATLNTSTDYFYYTYGGTHYADDATTAWAIEALTVLDSTRYAACIKRAVSYVKSGLSDDGSLDTSGWGGNADSSACVMEGLLVNNRSDALTGSWITSTTHPMDYLISWQDTDGSFTAYDYSGGSNVFNNYATAEGARCLGTYYLKKSFLEDACEEYDALQTKTVTFKSGLKTLKTYETTDPSSVKTLTWPKEKYKAYGKKGYLFKSWKKTTDASGNVTYKAIFKKLTTGQAKVLKVTGKKGKGVGFTATSRKYTRKNVGRRGFVFRYSTSKSMKNARVVKTGLEKNIYTKTGLKKGKTYYVQVRYYYLDSTMKPVYGVWSKAKKVKAS